VSSTACRECGAPIEFQLTQAGKWQPLNPDGSVHFATCAARPKNNYPRDVCIACGSTNVEEGPGAGPHYARLRCLACQSLRWLPHPDRQASHG